MDTLDRMSAEGQDQAVEKALKDAEKDVYEYEGKTYTAHPAATLFPLIKGDDFDALVASLALNGMRHPVLLLGDQIVDGRNRFRAAKKAGVKITFRQIDPDEDVCVVAMDMNIHRRDLTGNRRVVLASTLRRMSIRLEQLRREAIARAAREAREKEAAAALAAGGSDDAQVAGKPPQADPAAPGERSAEDAGGGSSPDPAPAAGVEGEAEAAAAEKTPSALDTSSSSLVSRKKAAELAGVSTGSLKRFDKVVEKAPELEPLIAEGKLSVADAVVVSEEDPELRRQVVDDVRAGRARTGAAAIEKRTGRAPKARSRPKKSGGAKAEADGAGGDVAGMPPLPSVGGGSDGKGGKDGAAPAGSAAPAAGAGSAAAGPAQGASRQLLPANAFSPSLLMAGVRKLMPAIAFDPCSSEAAQERIRALEWLSAEQDGCAKAWSGEAYVFPPPQFAGRFASKLMGEMMAGRVPRAVFLAPSDMADEDAGLLLRSSRLTGIVYELERSMFDVEDGNPVKAPSRMVLYVFGFERKQLYDAFDPWGKVLTVESRR
ncbi:MAG: hypothetical protein OXG04_28430 [Acidobacteria bacterium]|nr:hypothetical protein [Acidobacteriota bacterium]